MKQTKTTPASANELLARLASPLEGVANLTFLALEDSENPENVRLYMRMATEHLQAIRQIAGETYESGPIDNVQV
jgi:hypothetical protein